MAKYTGKPVTINQSAKDLYSKFCTMEMLQEKVNTLPDNIKAQMGELRFENDRLIIVTPQVGESAFRVKDRKEPSTVIFTAEGAPVPIDMSVNFTPESAESTVVTTTIDIDIPMMLKPMVGPHLQKAADKFGELMADLNR